LPDASCVCHPHNIPLSGLTPSRTSISHRRVDGGLLCDQRHRVNLAPPRPGITVFSSVQSRTGRTSTVPSRDLAAKAVSHREALVLHLAVCRPLDLGTQSLPPTR
jgi:hypothetical protein